MKVLFNPQITSIQHPVKTGKHIKTPSQKMHTVSDPRCILGCADKNICTSVSFKARDCAGVQKIIGEINLLKQERNGLLKSNISQAAKEAKDKLRKLANWNGYTERKWAESQADKAGEEAKKAAVGDHGSVWQFFHTDGSSEYWSAHSKKMDELYWNPLREINEIEKMEKTYRALVDSSERSEEDRKARIRQIDITIEEMQKRIDYVSLQNDVNEMLAAKGGVNDIIAGYEREKAEIETKFVQPLKRSAEDPEVNVPACVILYGPTGTGKTTFLNGIMEQSKDYARIVDLSNIKRAGSFLNIVDDELIKARKEFFKDGSNKRTIILLNDAEEIFTLTEEDAKILGVNLDGQDRTIIESAGNQFDKIAYFKSILDVVSKAPVNGVDDKRSATTFFVTTNYPHLIHPDLLSREGKASKIAIGLAADHNLEEVLKFYFKKADDLCTALKALDGNPDYVNFLNSIVGITKEGRENLKRIIESGDIKHLGVDYAHIPYDKIAEEMNPSISAGAYSNDCIRVICQNATFDYLEKNPSKEDFRDSFYHEYRNTKRDINPERLKKFNLIDRMIRDTEIDTGTLEELIRQRNMGILSPKKADLIKYHMTKIQTELESLKEREMAAPLNEREEARKAELEKLNDLIEGKKKAVDTDECDF